MFVYSLGLKYYIISNEISLIGGHFSATKIAARNGHNPCAGETLQIKAYNQPKFKLGQKLQDTCTGKGK